MRIVRFVLLAVAILLAASGVAQAATGHYSCVGQAYNGSTKQVGYGTKAKMYVYPKQSPQDGDWVNSIYAGNMYGKFYEAGWFWWPGASAATGPQGFAHYFNGLFHSERWFAPPAPGTRPVFAITNTGGSDTWRTYVDGVSRDIWFSTDIRSCYPCVGAERYDTLDYNKGQFLYTSYLARNGDAYNWAYWVDGGVNNDTDPNSNVYFNYLDRFDHYVYVDDHQN